jgi:hypothetical protein
MAREESGSRRLGPLEQDEWLSDQGWRCWPKHDCETFDRQWFRRVPTKTCCQMNQDKPGIQLQLKQWNHFKWGGNSIGYEIELHGGCVDLWSVRIVALGISHAELRSVADYHIKRLFAAWEVSNNEHTKR